MLGRFIMNKVALSVGLALLVLTAGCSSTMTSESFVRSGYNFSKIDNVAVIDVVGAVTSETAKGQIADEFSKQLLQKGYAPVQRDYILRLIKDTGYSDEDLSPEAYAIEVGRMLGYQYVLIVSIPYFDQEASITGKILETQDGSALWIASGSTEMGLAEAGDLGSDPFGNSLFGQTPQPMDTMVDNSPLSSEQRKAISKLVTRMCESLPDRTQAWMVAVEAEPASTISEPDRPNEPVVQKQRTWQKSKKIPVLWDLWPGNWGK